MVYNKPQISSLSFLKKKFLSTTYCTSVVPQCYAKPYLFIDYQLRLQVHGMNTIENPSGQNEAYMGVSFFLLQNKT